MYGDHRDLHVLTPAFPTRRSSDLMAVLPTERDLVVRQHAGDGLQPDRRWADEQFAIHFRPLFGDRTRQYRGIFSQPVHLPVSGDERYASLRHVRAVSRLSITETTSSLITMRCGRSREIGRAHV